MAVTARLRPQIENRRSIERSRRGRFQRLAITPRLGQLQVPTKSGVADCFELGQAALRRLVALLHWR
ncbi:MAG TPA: hypothetical protein DDZ51_01840 [Planctomycetaceae bacterium]|nr:hypothetical protein [Planctomycetaceae bacterium]